MATNMMPVYTAIVVAALAAASAVYTLTRQQQAATLKDRQQAYAAIMGKKHLRNQVFVSRFEALIFSDYHERRWKLAGCPEKSLDLEETQRWMHKSEDLALEIARTNQSLFESIGLARATFAPSVELTNLTERIYRFKTPVIAPPPENADQAALAAWSTQAVKEIQQLVEDEYGKPVDALLDYLQQHMRTKP